MVRIGFLGKGIKKYYSTNILWNICISTQAKRNRTLGKDKESLLEFRFADFYFYFGKYSLPFCMFRIERVELNSITIEKF
jgi:hypothetical protein